VRAAEGCLTPLSVCNPVCNRVPSSLPKSPFPRPSPQGTPEARPYSILRHMSSTSQSRAVLGAPQAPWARRGRRRGVLGGAAGVVAPKSRLNFLLCCRCCQALLPIFFSPAFSGRWVTSPRLVWRLPVAPRPRLSNALPPVQVWTRSIVVEISPLQRCQGHPETDEVKACECTSFA
jgi:hypothetical protein